MINKRKIGKLDLEVTEIGMGTAPLGGWPEAVHEKDASDTLETAWEQGIRYFDTAPLYGSGMAEIRVGNFLENKNRDLYKSYNERVNSEKMKFIGRCGLYVYIDMHQAISSSLAIASNFIKNYK